MSLRGLINNKASHLDLNLNCLQTVLICLNATEAIFAEQSQKQLSLAVL